MSVLCRIHALFVRGFRWRWDSWPIVLITLLTGPVLLLGYRIQRWNTCSRWDDEDRWAGTRLFAFTLPLLVYTPLLANLLFFHVSLVEFWLGLVFYDPFVWWIVLFPLAPTVALVLERIAPQTKSSQRVLLPAEKAPPPSPPPPPRPAAQKTPKRSTVIVEAISLPPRRPSSPPTPKKERDPRPIYQAWAVSPEEPPPQQPPLPMPSASEPETQQPPPQPQQKKMREKPDDGETINDIF